MMKVAFILPITLVFLLCLTQPTQIRAGKNPEFNLVDSDNLNPTENSIVANDRNLAASPYKTPYGSLQFSVIFSGDATWTARIPFQSTSFKSVPLYLYSNISWFDDDLDLFTCSEDNDTNIINVTNVLYLRQFIQGRKCQFSVKANDEDLEYNFISPNPVLSQTNGAHGGLGLGLYDGGLSFSWNHKPKEILFSIYLGENFQIPSHIIFGGQDPNFVGAGSPIKVSPISSSDWSLSLTGFSINKSPSVPFSLQPAYTAILDTNTPFIGIPEKEFDSIFFNSDWTFEKCWIDQSKQSIECDCERVLGIKSFDFVLGGQKIELPPSQFIEDFGDKCVIRVGCLSISQPSKCVTVNPAFENVWVLGGPFLSQFYTSFTLDLNSHKPGITFYPAKKEIDIRQALGNFMDAANKKSDTGFLETILIALGSFAALVLAFYFFKFCSILVMEKKNKYYKNQQDEVEEEEMEEVPQDNL